MGETDDSRKRISIVEGDEEMRTLLKRVRGRRYRVLVAPEGSFLSLLLGHLSLSFSFWTWPSRASMASISRHSFVISELTDKVGRILG